jgi:F0F1-type ATP synthase membrane subunit b/b'
MFIAHFNDVVFLSKLIDFVIFFGAILWLFNAYGKPMLVAHQEAQNRLVADAQAHRERSEAAVAAARAAIDRARLDGKAMVASGEAQAAFLIEREIAAAKERARRVVAHASGELERERYRVRRQLLEETVESAHAKAQELARREIDVHKQRALVAQLIDQLGRGRV